MTCVERANKLIDRRLKMMNVNETRSQHLVYFGGSILSSCASFQEMWIGRREWEEMGEVALRKKDWGHF